MDNDPTIDACNQRFPAGFLNWMVEWLPAEPVYGGLELDGEFWHRNFRGDEAKARAFAQEIAEKAIEGSVTLTCIRKCGKRSEELAELGLEEWETLSEEVIG